MKKKKKKKLQLRLWVWILFLIIALSGLGIAGYNIISWYKDNNHNEDIMKDLDDIVNSVEEVEDNENTVLVNEPEEKDETLNDYWYYIKVPLINVNFEELLKKNKETVAWVNVNNTTINYPVVQTSDNSYYLSHSYDLSSNKAGWVFMDYRNNANFTDKNTIIYGHSRVNGTMFGSLKNVLNESWYNNKDNHIIRISTPSSNTSWQIFSVYTITEETYYLTTNFSSDEKYEEFLNTLVKRSKFDFNTTLNSNDLIITLSTCYNKNERVVVHAKLIKKENKE